MHGHTFILDRTVMFHSSSDNRKTTRWRCPHRKCPSDRKSAQGLDVAREERDERRVRLGALDELVDAERSIAVPIDRGEDGVGDGVG